MNESPKIPPDEGSDRPTEDVEPEFFEFLTHDTLTLIKTGHRLARESELIFQELEDRADI